MRILGIDPGSRLTGYGCVERVGNQLVHITNGTLYLANTSGKAVIPLEERLLLIYEGLSKIIREFKPQAMAVEKVFLAKNAVSALKLGHARGAAILTGRIHQLEIFEYSATEVKQAVVGHGQADKEQVAKMVRLLMGQREFDTLDASDGLAVAICHAQFSRIPKNLNSGSFASALNQRKNKKLSLAEAVGAVAFGQNKRVMK
jgi:crossover junction endodeoxyribonuclease RuvC